MAFNAAGNGSSKLSLGLLNFTLAVSSGWALKHYSTDRHTLAGYGLLFAHSVFCILRYTHPNPGNVQRRLCEQSLRFSPALFVTLIIGHMQSILGGSSSITIGGIEWHNMVLGLYAGLLLLTICRRSLSTEKSTWGQLVVKLERSNLTLCVLWNMYCLWRIAGVDEYWWSLGLALQIMLNHFVLWRLTLRFNISTLEVDTVGMCFSIIFAINASQELIESTK